MGDDHKAEGGRKKSLKTYCHQDRCWGIMKLTEISISMSGVVAVSLINVLLSMNRKETVWH